MAHPPLTHLSFHVLLTLADGAKHGYRMIKEIEYTTRGAMTPATGTVYLALQRLLEEGLIEECAAPADKTDRRRKYYGLTPAGRQAVSHEAQRMAALLGAALRKDVVSSRVVDDIGRTT